jgi:hypothetical protein
LCPQKRFIEEDLENLEEVVAKKKKDIGEVKLRP